MTSAFLASTSLADILRHDQIISSEEVPQIYSDWIQIYSNPVSSPPSSTVLHHQPAFASSKLSEARVWEDEEQQQQQQHLGPPFTGFLHGSFPQHITRQPPRSYQAFRSFKPQSAAAASGAHQTAYAGSAAGGGHSSVDQVVPSHPQPLYWEVTQSQGHHHHHHHHHPQMGPQTSMGYISDLIYNAAIVTNFLEFWHTCERSLWLAGFFCSSSSTLPASVFQPQYCLVQTSLVLFVYFLKIDLNVDYLFCYTSKYSPEPIYMYRKILSCVFSFVGFILCMCIVIAYFMQRQDGKTLNGV